MRLELNGEPVEVRATTLAELVEEQGYPPRAVATALDGVFVPVPCRAATTLTDGVKVEVLSPMQGG
ncbi:sulfur carrier protein ThiS [Defluviimonas sp. WL0024]|uniref:Sulfur carrier protein ThiS n=2 Tax=Albidovulum TaxID=205889 RepID=A0ABT3J208_9RHOB|nr:MULTISPECIES: sulfur carrier protein ThiS [Defluviimonas]MCU9847526.1 sulfur carrier protein ThiS [Defluviimonas sp. WL0024]MCW3781718.1 sulfur carrier protein ThiS [Defluviimonas salinarum]